jgi:L-lactate dehydrogenase (cytochrome)/(S)-mandelate dehydrogenase
MVWGYVEGGADDQVTLGQNRAAFGRWRLRQRSLRGTPRVGLATEVAGAALSLPVLLAPTGLAGLSAWGGDVAAARAAEAGATLLMLSSASSYSLEEVAEATEGPGWFQLYPWGDREFCAILIERARAAGYDKLTLTVDVPTVGNREAERLRGMGIPPTLTPRRALDAALHPRWAYGFLRHRRVSMRNLVVAGGLAAGVEAAEIQLRQMTLRHVVWDDLSWLRERWEGPLFVKGLLDADDAETAVDLGADGIVVSNHGGRQLDEAQATLDSLPAIAARVGGRAPILLDGGIRRGSDVIKALCLGADAVMIGRPYLYGLAVGGQGGVEAVIEILREELARTLVLMGCPSIDELDRSWLIAAD